MPGTERRRGVLRILRIPGEGQLTADATQVVLMRKGTRTVLSMQNNFQGRYAIRHKWTGPIKCAAPKRNVWGGPPDGGALKPTTAMNLAFATRGAVKLQSSIKQDVPELGLKGGVLEATKK